MANFTVTKELTFDSGHRVPNHKSKCFSLHGHTYRLQVTVEGQLVTDQGSSDEGMVIDFGDLKEIMIKYVHDLFDHAFIIYRQDPLRSFLREFEKEIGKATRIVVVDYIPTAENLAADIFAILNRQLSKGKLVSVRLWETPTSMSEFSAPVYHLHSSHP